VKLHKVVSMKFLNNFGTLMNLGKPVLATTSWSVLQFLLNIYVLENLFTES